MSDVRNAQTSRHGRYAAWRGLPLVGALAVFCAVTIVGANGAIATPATAPAGRADAHADGRPRATSGDLVVFAAASLKEVFARLAVRFEQGRAGVHVAINSAGSQELRAQIEHGARPDVFASADRKQMELLQGMGLINAPVVFTCNRLVLVVRSGMAPPAVSSFRDLGRVERLVIGADQVPVGSYTMQVLDRAGALYGTAFRSAVLAKVVSRELNVRQVLAKVVLGEADAGIVYGSDIGVAGSSGKLRVVPIPSELNVTAEYPMAVLKETTAPGLAQQWVSWVRSPAAAAAFHEAGFASCPGAP